MNKQYAWSGLISDGASYSLPEASQQFRQKLSLEPDVSLSVPDLSHAQAKIIGPLTDLLTIYSDLWWRQGKRCSKWRSRSA
jgi:hypothetical protein